ncbi:MAG: zinc protease [Clostridiales bacterium]|nr:zinc protease [Clostridiales bacterium]MDN5281422.1 zinc protease [Candidatus Ozemobacter sp.]
MNSKKFLQFVLLVLFTIFATQVQAEPGKLFTLDNGLKVFIKEAKASPVVAINFWVKVGSVNEEPGQEGYAHLIEHMMFKGTKAFPYGVLDNEVKQMGAKQNAFTANDYTCYYLVGASKYFERMFELESDAVLNSVFDAEELKKESQVVIEELKMSLDNPGNRIVQLIMKEAFKVHPYKHPIVGYLNNLEEVTREKLYSFYKKFYVPSNMWVIIVGDVNTDEALDVVKKYMGNAPRVEKPIQRIPNEPEQKEQRLLVEHGDLQHSYIRMGWHVPGMQSDDRFALYLMARIAGGGMSSWLWQELVEDQQIAISAGAGYFSSQFPMLFQIGALTTPGKARIFTEKAKEIIYRFLDGKVTEEELNKAKQQVIASDIYGKETAEDYANKLGHYALLASVWDTDKFVDQIRQVSLEDLTRVAGKYFRDTNLTIARYEPKPPAPDSKPEMITLDNGVRLILKENHSSPLVAVSVKIGAGGLREGRREAGLANLTTEMLFKGANDMTAEEIAKKFESMGSRFSCQASKSYTSFTMQALTEKFVPTLELFLDILEKPDFPENEFDKMKNQVLDWIKSEEDDLYKFTANNALETLFPGTPIGYSSYGKADDVQKLKRSDLKDFHKKYFVGSNIVVAIVGDFYPSEMKEELLKQFGRFKDSKVKEIDEPKLKEITEPIKVDLQKNREQAQIIYVARTFPGNDEKSAAMSIIQSILSGSMSSRLFKNLRAKDSLAYSTWAFNVGMVNAGYFQATISTAASKVATATTRLKEEIDSFRDQGFSDKEFEDAKKYIIGQHALSLVDNLSLAQSYSSDEFFGKGFDYAMKYPDIIASTTREQVEQVAKDYLLASGSYVLTITQP